MRRRQFIAGLGSAAAWPVVAQAQQGDRVRRIGVLMAYHENDDPVWKPRLSAFTQALADLGWTGGNVRIELRWGRSDSNRIRAPVMAGITNFKGAFRPSSNVELTYIYSNQSKYIDIKSGSCGTHRATLHWDFCTGVGAPNGGL
jgi:hypothetical protein